MVEVPRLPVTLNAWTGSAWRVEDPGSGAAGYFLAGGLAGGATTEEVPAPRPIATLVTIIRIGKPKL